MIVKWLKLCGCVVCRNEIGDDQFGSPSSDVTFLYHKTFHLLQPMKRKKMTFWTFYKINREAIKQLPKIAVALDLEIGLTLPSFDCKR